MSLLLRTGALILMCASLAKCEDLPMMRDALPETVLARAGEYAVLPCAVRGGRGGRGAAVQWRRHSDGRVLAAAGARVTPDTRFSVITSSGHETTADAVWGLAVRQARPSDSGVYVCELATEPPVRSFHTLVVLPRDLTSNNKTLQETYSESSRDPTSASNLHNYTDCCIASNVSEGCYGFCSIQSILDSNTGQDSENCEQEFPAIRKCMTDGRNHVPCCIQEKIPLMCQDVCKGQFTPDNDRVKSHVSCLAYTEQTLACIVGGIELLPSPPLDLEVEPLTEKSLKVSWGAPAANYASVTEYVINVTSLQSFDGTSADSFSPLFPPVEPASFQIKVPANKRTTTLNDLSQFTMYEITVTSINIHGSSLPSNALRSLTLTPGMLKPLKVAEPPHLPDMRQCCATKGITSAVCLDTFCDPRNAVSAKGNDIVQCAPHAPDVFSCLADGHDHSACCRSHGLPPPCQDLCRANVSNVDYSHLKCLEYMSDYTNCLLQGYGVLPGPPARLRVVYSAPDYAVLRWGPPAALGDTVQYYDLHFRDAGTGSLQYASFRKVHSPYILDNLESNKKYEVYISPVNAHGIGQPSARIIFRTQSKILEEETKKSLAYNETSCCAAVSLSEVCMPLCSYDAKMSDVKSLVGLCSQEFHKVLRCGVGGRNHGKCCERRGVPESCQPLCRGVIQDSAQNITKNCLPYIGNIVQCFEEGSGLLPMPVEELYATVLSNASVRIKWSAPVDGNNVTHYIVHYQKILNESLNDLTFQPENEINTTKTSEELGDLEEGTTYKIFVTAHNKHGSSLPSSVVILNTTSPLIKDDDVAGVTSPPHALAVAGHSATWITFSWQPPVFSHPKDYITYEFHYKQSGDEAYSSKTTTVTSHTLENLGPNRQYSVFVTAHVPPGGSRPSETLVAWTDPAYPAFVESPTIHPVNLVMEGSSMTILCIAMGTPMPTISLYISGRLIRQEITRHMVTKIHNVTREMDQISCYADNGYGTPMQASRKITISHMPSIQVGPTTLAVLGGTAALECNVTALPQPQMAFWRDPLGRVPVIQGPKYAIDMLPDNEEKSKYTMRLTISSMTELDEGDYFCHAENAFGAAVQPAGVRLHGTATAHNVSQCCLERNVSAACMDACGFYLDMDAVVDRPECVADFDKLMKCAADGSDHRSCCAALGVPRRCLDWCRGEPLLSAKLCVLSHTRQIAGCFHEGRDKLPGPPQNVRIVALDDQSVRIKWERPMKNPHTVEIYRVFWRPIGVRAPNKLDTKDLSLHVGELKEGVTYECVIKAGNHYGTSALTEPVQFTVGNKYILATTSVETHFSRNGLLLAILLLCGVIVAVLIGSIWLIRNRKIFGIKTVSGVAFENPSYLKEINPETVQTEIAHNAIVETSNSAIKSHPASSEIVAPRLEQLQVQQEVNPSLYEELKLGHDGVGFKRLKLIAMTPPDEAYIRSPLPVDIPPVDDGSRQGTY